MLTGSNHELKLVNIGLYIESNQSMVCKTNFRKRNRSYLDQMLFEIFEAKRCSLSYSLPETPSLPRNIAGKEMPSKEELRRSHSRFIKT